MVVGLGRQLLSPRKVSQLSASSTGRFPKVPNSTLCLHHYLHTPHYKPMAERRAYEYSSFSQHMHMHMNLNLNLNMSRDC